MATEINPALLQEVLKRQRNVALDTIALMETTFAVKEEALRRQIQELQAAVAKGAEELATVKAAVKSAGEAGNAA